MSPPDAPSTPVSPKRASQQVKPCDRCAKSFTPNRSWQRFCSMECRQAFWQAVREQAQVIVMKGG